MGISNVFRAMARVLWQGGALSETLLDGWIEDALREEALAQPPATTWDHLRQMLEGRRQRRYGMWVLDEPLHDPPHMFSASGTTFANAQHPWGHYRTAQPYTAESVAVHLTFALAAFINY